MMRGIRFCGCGCGCQSEYSFSCFGGKTYTKGWRVRSPMRPEEDEGRNVPERPEESKKEQGSQQKRAVNRRDQELGPVDHRPGCPT